jgi:hypothetical protein
VKTRYANPMLHEGRWSRPQVIGEQLPRVEWRLLDRWRCGGLKLDHRAVVCNIGPGMAHVDVCECGKKRYGVFGSWS